MIQPKRETSLRRSAVCLLVFVLLLLCLTGCSDEIYNPTQDSLSINEGSGDGNGGSGYLEIPTEAPTGSVIQIPVTDPFENADHVMRADFLNVGNADAILLRLDDIVILMDTGESDDYHTIRTRLDDYGIHAIDYLVISHFDNDHIGTASQILGDYTVGTVYMPDYVRDSSLYRRMMSTLEVLEGKTTVHRLTEDAHVNLPYGSLWINPTRLYEPGQTLGSDASHSLEENNYSLITSVRFGEIELLLTGDAERERMEEFAALEEVSAWSYELIKTPHHGGYDKALGRFIQDVKPRYCAVCVGDASLVEVGLVTAMRSVGAAAYYTCDGGIRFASDGVSMTMNRE